MKKTTWSIIIRSWERRGGGRALHPHCWSRAPSSGARLEQIQEPSQHMNTCEHPLWDYSRTSDAAQHTEIISYIWQTSTFVISLRQVCSPLLLSSVHWTAFLPSISACIALKRVVQPKMKIQSSFAQNQCFFPYNETHWKGHFLVTSILHISCVLHKEKSQYSFATTRGWVNDDTSLHILLNYPFKK